MTRELKRAAQALEADAAVGAEPATAEADGGGAGAQQRGVAGRAQQRAKKADDYHARHAAWVAEFNELTGGECAGGEGGVKWVAVRAWQQKHWQANNLLADGLVGPKTIEAAKIVAKKSGAAKDEKADAKSKEQDTTHPGQAEGAEASVDKPRLDDQTDDQDAPAAEHAGENKGPLKADGKKVPTLVEFEQAVSRLDAALATFKQPQGGGPQRPVAQHYVEGTDDKDAPPALGEMMSKAVLGDYKKAAKTLHDQWDNLDARARANALLDAVNNALSSEKVPPILRVDFQNLTNPAEFLASEWAMKMNERLFSKLRSPGIDEVGQVASMVFHEGRHAEQRFSIARLIATKNPSDSLTDVARKAGVNDEIAAQAMKLRSTPLPAQQQQSAEAFQHATRDNPDQHKEIERAAGDITDAANHVAAIFRTMSPGDQAITSARWQDLRQRTIVALEAYYALATERDAYAAQKQLNAAATSK
jgi:hypothetical protein